MPGTGSQIPQGANRTGGRATVPAGIDVRKLLDDVRSTSRLPRALLLDGQIRLHVFRGDPVPIAACLRALLGCAAMGRDRDDGRLTVRCEQSGDFAVFTVHDDGAVREPQGLLSDDTGLETARSIAESRGGALQVRPLVADRGFLARLSWPLNAHTAPARAPLPRRISG